MSQEKVSVIVHDDDVTTVEFARFALHKVFGLKNHEIERIVKDISRLGQVEVFTGDRKKAEKLLADLKELNNLTDNSLEASIAKPKIKEDYVLSSFGLSIQADPSAGFHDSDFIHMASQIVAVAKLDRNAIEDIAERMSLGEEVLIKEFGSTDRAQDKAQALSELIKYSVVSDFAPVDDPYDRSIVLTVQKPGHTFSASAPVSRSQAEQEQKQELFDGLTSFAADLIKEQLDEMTQGYASEEDFLQNASPEKKEKFLKTKREADEFFSKGIREIAEKKGLKVK